MRYDVAIIGAGCVGVMTARLLSQKKCTVAVLEAKSDVAMASTGANSAIVHAGYDTKPNTLKAKLNVRGNYLMKEIAKELDVELKEVGSHVVGFGEEDEKTLAELYNRGIANGVPDLKLLNMDELRRMEPNISPDATASLYAPSAAISCPYGITIAAAENAATNGVEFYFDFKVVSSEKQGEGYLLSNGTKTVEARYVINCAGVYSAEIAKMLGETDFPISITPRRGEYFILDKACGGMANSTLFVCPSALGKGILVSPTVHGNIIVGPNAYEIDDPSDTSTTAEGLAEITAGAKRLMPSIDMRMAITSFSGVRATPNRYDFYIEESHKLDCIIHAVGVESPGFASSPAVAEYILSILEKIGFACENKEDYISTRRKDGNHKQFNMMTEEEKIAACKKDSAYGKIVCRCETVTEGDVIDALNSPIPAKTVDMMKKRLRAGMGRCQGGFCSPRVASLIAEHFSLPLSDVTKSGGDSYIVLKGEEK